MKTLDGRAASARGPTPATINVETACYTQFRESPLSWFALRVRATAERHTAQLLSWKGYHCLAPTMLDPELLPRQKRERPLFAGYIFCHFALSDKLTVLKTPGVQSIAGTGRSSTPVPDAEIRNLQEVIRRGFVLTPWISTPAGSAVRILKGPLSGLCGHVVSVKSRFRILLGITLLQQFILAELDHNCPSQVGACDSNSKIVRKSMSTISLKARRGVLSLSTETTSLLVDVMNWLQVDDPDFALRAALKAVLEHGPAQTDATSAAMETHSLFAK